MKKIVLLTAVSGLFLAPAYPVYLPTGSNGDFARTALPPGTVSTVDNWDGTSSLVIGNGTSLPNAVVDVCALRGSEVKMADPSDYSIAADSNFTYDGRIWVMDATAAESPTKVGVITIMSGGQFAIDSVTVGYESINTAGIGDGIAKMRQTVYDGGRKVELMFGSDEAISGQAPPPGTAAIPYRLTVSSITVRKKTLGSSDAVNDLSTKSFTLKDSEGEIDFYNLRHDCYHHNDGNLGENWASYWATNDVRVGTKYVGFGQNDSRYRIVHGPIPTNGLGVVTVVTNGLRVVAAGHDMITMYGQSNDSGKDYDPIRWLNVNSRYVVDDDGNTQIALEYTHSLDNFKAELLTLWYTHGQLLVGSHTNAAAWTLMTNTVDYTKIGNNAVVLTQAFRNKMDTLYHGEAVEFVFRYGGIVANYFRIDVWKPVIIHNDFIKWSEDDHKYYKCKIVGGAWVIEPWTDQYEPDPEP